MAYEQYLDDPTYGMQSYLDGLGRGQTFQGIDEKQGYRIQQGDDGGYLGGSALGDLREGYNPQLAYEADMAKQGVIAFGDGTRMLEYGANQQGFPSIESYVQSIQGPGEWGTDQFGNRTYKPASGTIASFPAYETEATGLMGFVQSPVFKVAMAGLGGVLALEGGFAALLGGGDAISTASWVPEAVDAVAGYAGGVTPVAETVAGVGGLSAETAGFLQSAGYAPETIAQLGAQFGADGALLGSGAAAVAAGAGATNTPNYSGPEYQSGLDDLQLRPQDTPLGPSSYGGTAAAGLTAAALEAGATQPGLIDRLLDWGSKNQTLVSAGLQVGGGLLKGAFSPSPEEIAKARAQAEIEADAAKRAATSASGVRARVTPTGKFLRTPYNIGLINGRM
jgi:hypothetical protein